MFEEFKVIFDWSKAPAEAQFWGPKNRNLSWNEGWYKQDESGRWMFCHTGAHSWTGSSLDNTTPERYADRLDQLIARLPAALASNDVDSW